MIHRDSLVVPEGCGSLLLFVHSPWPGETQLVVDNESARHTNLVQHHIARTTK